MAYDVLRNELISDLSAEIQAAGDDKFNESLLTSKVGAAIRDVKTARRYTGEYTEAMIESDLTDRYYSQIRRIALFDYNQTGSEGQTQYSADGVSIHYVERDKLFSGIIPLGRTS